MKEQTSVCGELAWECLGSFDQPARDLLVMDPENSADHSYPHPFEIELTGLFLKNWIFASCYCFKDPSADLATVGHPDWCHSE